MIGKKINLLGMDRDQLQKLFLKLGEESFRADQVMKWMYHCYYDDFDQMTNLSKTLKKKLKGIAEIRAPSIAQEKISVDGTIKWGMKIDDQQQIETVYIPENFRSTLCLSSQVGCPLGCNFCGTAQQGFNRNLRVSEIIGQIWRVVKLIQIRKKCDKNVSEKNRFPITNIVMMGMGEPLLNFVNVTSAIKIMLDRFGFGLSQKRITLSTSGIVPGINKLGKILNISLAVSLHAPNDVLRSKLMPINQKYNINDLFCSIRQYLKNSNNKKITIEYLMLNRINDKLSHAYQLIEKIKNIRCKVNLIPWNQISNIQYTCSSNNRINFFLRVLLQNGIFATVRKRRGIDINAACGQLDGVVNDRAVFFSSS